MSSPINVCGIYRFSWAVCDSLPQVMCKHPSSHNSPLQNAVCSQKWNIFALTCCTASWPPCCCPLHWMRSTQLVNWHVVNSLCLYLAVKIAQFSLMGPPAVQSHARTISVQGAKAFLKYCIEDNQAIVNWIHFCLNLQGDNVINFCDPLAGRSDPQIVFSKCLVV